MKQSIGPSIQTQRQKQLFTIQTIILCLNQSMVRYDKNRKTPGRKLWLDY